MDADSGGSTSVVAEKNLSWIGGQHYIPKFGRKWTVFGLAANRDRVVTLSQKILLLNRDSRTQNRKTFWQQCTPCKRERDLGTAAADLARSHASLKRRCPARSLNRPRALAICTDKIHSVLLQGGPPQASNA